MSFTDLDGPPGHSRGKLTRPGTVGYSAVTEVIGVGRASDTGGVASGLVSLRRIPRDILWGIRVYFRGGSSGSGLVPMDSIGGSLGSIAVGGGLRHRERPVHVWHYSVALRKRWDLIFGDRQVPMRYWCPGARIGLSLGWEKCCLNRRRL